jgi:protein TonB
MGAPARPGALPTTRLRRRRVGPGWGFGATFAALANLVVIAVLVRISAVDHPPPPMPMLARRIDAVEPPPTDAPEPSEPEAPSEEPPPEAPQLALALPALDLAAAPAASDAFALPELPAVDRPLDLPFSVPAFAAIASEGAPGATATGAIGGPLVFDEAPVIAPGIDFRRHYPRTALLRKIGGESLIRLRISASGRVEGVTVIASTPPGVFDEAAERLGSRSMRVLSPAKKGGAPVACTFDYKLTWKP